MVHLARCVDHPVFRVLRETLASKETEVPLVSQAKGVLMERTATPAKLAPKVSREVRASKDPRATKVPKATMVPPGPQATKA